MRRWQPILTALEEFSRHLAPDVPALLIEHANDHAWSQERYLQYRNETGYWRKRGVYLHFSADEQLLYIGMAGSGFDRFWGSRADDVRYTDVIPIEEPYGFLIPSLELFLIRRFNPPQNTRGRCDLSIPDA